MPSECKVKHYQTQPNPVQGHRLAEPFLSDQRQRADWSSVDSRAQSDSQLFLPHKHGHTNTETLAFPLVFKSCLQEFLF